MANSNKKTPKKKHSLADYIKVYKKRFANLDKKTKIQLIAIVVLVVLIVIAAFAALFGRGKNPASTSDIQGTSISFSGSYDPFADDRYEDEYLKLIKEYDDVVIPENETEDRNYFRETLFVGDSNTEGLATYNHLSLQYVLGMTGMPIQQVTTNKCMWFVGYEEPVTIPAAVSMLKPRRIIINFGTNNAGGTETEDFIYYYEGALNAIEKAYPYADIIVSAVLPVAKVRDYPNITMQDIDEFNMALAEMCRDRDIKFLNTAEIFKDPENGFMKPEYIAKDGIHLNSDGYKAFLDYVGSHKHVEPDNRPARGTIPTRRNAPYVPEGSSSIAASSVVSSSSLSSSIISSSAVSSSRVPSSSVISSSSIGSSSNVPSSSIGASSSVPSSSQVPSSSVQGSSSEETSTPADVCIYCGKEHKDTEHECSECGVLGHEKGGQCTPPPVKCDLCTESHATQEHPCSGCGKLGHELNGQCPPKCSLCSGEHTDDAHPCSTCGQTGHGDTCPTPEPSIEDNTDTSNE